MNRLYGREAGISEDTLNKVRTAMCQVTASGGGAHSLFANFLLISKLRRKLVRRSQDKAVIVRAIKEYYDGLFICFAPADDPEIAFACVMEYGYSGSGSAGRVAKAVLEEYFWFK